MTAQPIEEEVSLAIESGKISPRSLISLRYCTALVWSMSRLAPVVSGPKHQILRASESGKISPRDDFKARARVLADEYGWDVTDARKIWFPAVLVSKDTGTSLEVVTGADLARLDGEGDLLLN
jgi:hypothetical protein